MLFSPLFCILFLIFVCQFCHFMHNLHYLHHVLLQLARKSLCLSFRKWHFNAVNYHFHHFCGYLPIYKGIKKW